MKNTVLAIILLGIPAISFCQTKTTTKTTTTKVTKTTQTVATPGVSCQSAADGVHLMLSGKDYDAEGVVNPSGNFVFTNVPAGDKVITRTGEDKASPSCRFVINCQGSSKNFSRSGSFKELSNGVAFKMVQAGTVTFTVK